MVLKSIEERLVTQIRSELENMVKDIADLRAGMAEIRGRLTINEENIDNIHKKIKEMCTQRNDYMKNDRQQEIVNKIRGELNALIYPTNSKLDEHIKDAEERYGEYLKFIEEYKKDVTPTLERINNEYMDGSRGERLSSRLFDLPAYKPLVENANADVDLTASNISSSNISNNKCDIDCEVLFIGDSNLKPLKPEIMNNGTICQKVICYTLDGVIEFINSANIIVGPKKVYFQVGTNDLDDDNLEMDIFLCKFERVLQLLKSKLGNIVVVVSSFLPRKDRDLTDVNEKICDLVDVTPKITFMSTHTITGDMLRDNKHLNKVGFSILLSNIRYMIFGKLPKLRSRPNFNPNNRFRWSNTSGPGDGNRHY